MQLISFEWQSLTSTSCEVVPKGTKTDTIRFGCWANLIWGRNSRGCKKPYRSAICFPPYIMGNEGNSAWILPKTDCTEMIRITVNSGLTWFECSDHNKCSNMVVGNFNSLCTDLMNVRCEIIIWTTSILQNLKIIISPCTAPASGIQCTVFILRN